MQNQTTTNSSSKNSQSFSNNQPSEAFEEGTLTKAIETRTAQVPSGVYLGLAIGSMALSATLALLQEKKGWANFVGQWAPSFLIMGLYNKLVKVEGSDRTDSMH